MELMPPNHALPQPCDDIPALIDAEYHRLTQYAIQRKQSLVEKQSKGLLVAGFTARDGKVRELIGITLCAGGTTTNSFMSYSCPVAA